MVVPADPGFIHLFFKFYPNLPTLAASAELELETIAFHYLTIARGIAVTTADS